MSEGLEIFVDGDEVTVRPLNGNFSPLAKQLLDVGGKEVTVSTAGLGFALVTSRAVAERAGVLGKPRKSAPVKAEADDEVEEPAESAPKPRRGGRPRKSTADDADIVNVET